MRILALVLLFSLLFGAMHSGTVVADAKAPATAVSALLPAPKTAPPALSAGSAVLFDPASCCFLAERDADRRRPMASTTKIMTALVVIERCSLGDTVTVSPEAVGVEGSSIYLYAGERITVGTLLFGLLLSSANDAATALAIHVAGSVAAFAQLMNERGAEMGLVDTHFTNPHGLHDEAHYTTARELALIAATAMANETFAEIVATKRYSAPQSGTDATRLFLNHNRLLRTYEGAIGIKTGFTKKSGRCLVSAARRNGLTLIAVTLDDGNDWRDHAALFDWGFAEYEGFAPEPAPITLPVVGGRASEVTLLPGDRLYRTLPAGHDEIEVRIEAPRFLFAGFEAGEVLGEAVYVLNGEELGRIPLKAANGVEKAKIPRTFFDKLKSIFTK